MPSFEELRQWLQAVRLVHHIRGRVRLKLTGLPDLRAVPTDQARARSVQAVLERVQGIRSLHLNPLALSCTVEYDPVLIPMQAWPDYVSGQDSAEARVLDGVLRSAYQEIVHAEPR
ncbi:MAG: hypothetical protein C0451_09615 [Comamonadaceae bacterium]|nr:hypothetical protein [Comamonadaceae bacterium]